MPSDIEADFPDGYHDADRHPIGGTHPMYPDFYRASGYSMSRVKEASLICDECPMKQSTDCDYTCGSGNAWVSAVTWIRIRMMENQDEH